MSFKFGFLRKKVRNIIAFILFLLLTFQVLGQVPNSHSFSEQYDFYPKAVYNLFEDDFGNIWFGTETGLYKFNGGTFKLYKNSDFSFEYTNIKQDKLGQIWCQNFFGQIFLFQDDSLRLFYDLNEFYTISFSFIVSDFPIIRATSKNGIINIKAVSKEISFIQDTSGKKIVTKKNGKSALVYPCSDMQAYKKGFVFNSKNHHLVFYKSEKYAKKLFSYSQEPKRMREAGSFVINDSTLLVLQQFEENKTLMTSIFSKPNYTFEIPGFLLSFFYDKEKKQFWFGTNSGIFVYDKHYKLIFEKILPNFSANTMMKDREGNIWLGTSTNGIHIFPNSDVLKFTDDLSEKNILRVHKVSDKKILLVCRQGEIFELEKGGNPKLLITLSNKIERSAYDPFSKQLHLMDKHVKTFDLRTKQIYKNSNISDFKQLSFINQKFAISSHSGAAKIIKTKDLIPKKGNFPFDKIKGILGISLDYPRTKQYQLFIRTKRSYFNAYDKKSNSFYVSYTDALIYYTEKSQKKVKFQDKEIIAQAMTNRKSGGVWVFTANGYLLEIFGAKVLRNFKINQEVVRILEHENEVILASTVGVIRLDLKTKTYKIITTLEGLLSNTVNDIELLGNDLYATTTKGLSKIPLNFNPINQSPPKIKINRIQIMENDTILLKNYNLPYNKNSISIFFQGISNKSQTSFSYKYRMLGIDSTWILQKSSTNFARFPSLSPGNYTFEVKTVNEDGIESESASVIQIIVQKPYYQTWWFYLLIILLTVSFVSILFILRIRVMRKQNKLLLDREVLEKKLSNSQLSTLKAQLNPHFVFNALNSIQDYIISNNKELASDYLGLFADLMRKYLHFSQKDELTLQEEIEMLEMYLELEKVRFEDQLNYKIVVGDALFSSEIKIPVMFIQPFVENAIKHGLLHKKDGVKQLRITFKKIENYLKATIEDNGVGRKRSTQINLNRKPNHKSFASSALEKRVELINKNREQKIEILITDLYKDEKATGTKVEILFWIKSFSN